MTIMKANFYDFGSILTAFNSINESIEACDWSVSGPTGIFADRNARVLGFTHEDLDGVVAGAIQKNVYPNDDLHFINYGKKEADAYAFASEHAGEYDCIVFTDYTPNIDSDNGAGGEGSMFDKFKKIGLPMLVIDHHAKVLPVNNPEDNTYVMVGKCGAYRAMQFFRELDPDLKKFDDLVEYTNTQDMYLGKTKPPEHAQHAKRLSNLCFMLAAGASPNWDFKLAVDRFMDGNAEFTEEELNALVAKETEDENAYQAQEKIPLPGNGIMVSKCKNFSYASSRMDESGYAYSVHETHNPSTDEYKLSFRLYPGNFPDEFKKKYHNNPKEMEQEANINVIMQRVADGEGGIPMSSNGGGGHPNAGGRQCLSEQDMKDYVTQYSNVIAKMFRGEGYEVLEEMAETAEDFSDHPWDDPKRQGRREPDGYVEPTSYDFLVDYMIAHCKPCTKEVIDEGTISNNWDGVKPYINERSELTKEINCFHYTSLHGLVGMLQSKRVEQRMCLEAAYGLWAATPPKHIAKMPTRAWIKMKLPVGTRVWVANDSDIVIYNDIDISCIETFNFSLDSRGRNGVRFTTELMEMEYKRKYLDCWNNVEANAEGFIDWFSKGLPDLFDMISHEKMVELVNFIYSYINH